MRSGSTFLCNMLKDTKVFDYPNVFDSDPLLKIQSDAAEFLAPNHNLDPWDKLGIPKTKDLCIKHLEMKASQYFNPPVLIKLLKEQYKYYLLEPSDRTTIEAYFPNPKYIWLERKDIFARTISAYQFFVSKTPHIWDKNMKSAYEKKRINFDIKGVLDVYNNHIKDGNWNDYLNEANYHYIEYEDLIADPTQVLKGCLNFLKITNIDAKQIVEKQPKFKTERPETQQYIKKLKRLVSII